MSSYAGGYGPAYPPPGYPPPGYPQYQGYPPYQSYPPPPPEIKPGIIALRPLNLTDMFNGAVAYIRANPKTTLGMTTIVVVITQVIAMLLQYGPLALSGSFDPSLATDEPNVALLVGSTAGALAGGAATWVSAILLSGLLTVIVGRAVFGSGITFGEAWQRLRGRLPALVGFTALETLGAALLVAVVAGIIALAGFAVNGWAAFVVGVPLVFGLIATFVYLGTMLSFAPTLIVLERLPVVPAIQRSFALVRNDFWRVFGIRLLATLVAGLIAGAVSVPFAIGGQVLIMVAGSAAASLLGLMLVAIGNSIGQILTAPFTAGVVVLQYTDRRIRAEAFDLVLQTGAGRYPGAPADSTDHLWLTRHP